MPEITRKRVGELVRGVFEILVENPDGLPVKTVLGRLEKAVPPTDFENSTYPNRPDVRRYDKIVRFSTVTAVKAGWMTKNKGLWSLTEVGKKALREFRDPERFAIEAGRLYRQWRRENPPEDENVVEESSSEAGATLEEAEEAAWSEVERHLTGMNPYDFQNLVAGLLRGMRYHVIWVAPPGPDRGVDIIAHTDPLGISGPRIKVQVKRLGERTSVKEIRLFMAVLAEGDVGLFVAAAGFTKEAEDEVRSQEKRRLMLVDLRRLFDLWVEHYEKIPEAQRSLLLLRPIYFLAPPE